MPSSSLSSAIASLCTRLVLLAAVAVLHDRHAGALEVEQLVPGALEGGEREARRAGVEVDGSHARPSTPRQRGVEAQSAWTGHGSRHSSGRAWTASSPRPTAAWVPEALRAGGARVRRLLRLGGHAAHGPEDVRDGARLRRLALPRQAGGGADPEPANPALRRALPLRRARGRCSPPSPPRARATSTPTAGEVVTAFLAAGCLDALVVTVVPVVLGSGIRLFATSPGRHSALAGVGAHLRVGDGPAPLPRRGDRVGDEPHVAARCERPRTGGGTARSGASARTTSTWAA